MLGVLGNLTVCIVVSKLKSNEAIWFRTGFTPKKASLLQPCRTFSSMQTAYIDGTCRFIRLKQPYLGISIFWWDYFGPCLIMEYCLKRVSMNLRTQDCRTKWLKGEGSSIPTVSGQVSETSPDDRKTMSRSRNVTKTFLFVFFAFVFCWATHQFLFLQRNLGGYSYHGNPENHFANTMAILNPQLIQSFMCFGTSSTAKSWSKLFVSETEKEKDKVKTTSYNLFLFPR